MALRAMLTIAAVAVLSVAIFLQAGSQSGPTMQSARRIGRLQEEVPLSGGVWEGLDQPIGPDEVSKGTAEQLLRYDDYVYRRYTAGNREFSVYIAQWFKGKMPTRLIAEHTPDRCWVENGWTCHQRRTVQGLRINGHLLPPAEWRRFSTPDGKTSCDVLFWLIVGNEVFDFQQHHNLLSHSAAWWHGVWRERDGRDYAEKIFIRISSNESFDQLWMDSGFQTVLRAIEDIAWRKVSGTSASEK